MGGNLDVYWSEVVLLSNSNFFAYSGTALRFCPYHHQKGSTLEGATQQKQKLFSERFTIGKIDPEGFECTNATSKNRS